MRRTCIGIDLIEISRIRAAVDRWGEKFLSRIYTEAELERYRSSSESLAARFAAKEAAVKALSSPQAGYLRWRDIEILSESNGQPILKLYGKALQLAQESRISTFEVSLSHTRENAIAIVIGLSDEN